MAYVVVMPVLGQTMEEGTVTAWLKEEGQSVTQGDPLLTVETDKAEVEVESDYTGVLTKILAHPEDGEITCLEPIAIIGEPDEVVDVEAVLQAFKDKQ